MTTVRAATAQDADVLAALRWGFRAAQDPPVEARDAFIERCRAWMARELAAGMPWRAWVAVRSARIVGQVWVNLIEKLPNPAEERERIAYISNLFVRPEDRGGVGTPLLETALDWARANAVDRIILWPSKRSVTLYLRHGFTKNGNVMELLVGPPHPAGGPTG